MSKITIYPFLCLIALSLPITRSLGQKGQVLDGNTSSPVAKAVVMHRPSWAMVMTDETGRFDFTGKVTGMGYKTKLYPTQPLNKTSESGVWFNSLGVAQARVLPGRDPLAFQPGTDGIFFLQYHGFTFRWLRVQSRWIGGRSESQRSQAFTSLAKTGATTESLSISRFGYDPVSIPLTGLDLGSIRLTSNPVAPPPGMRKLAGGTFLAGSTGDTVNARSHQVTVNGFYIDTTEITQEDYALVTGQRPWELRSETYWQWFKWNYKASVGMRYPALLLTWDETALYCNLRSKRDGLDTAFTYQGIAYDRPNHPILQTVTVNIKANGYRLPTEPEWEYACKGGQDSDYFWGTNRVNEDSSQAYAWYQSNAPKYKYSNGLSLDSATQAPVAMKAPNPYGLYDMVGNVVEFIADMEMTPYTSASENNPFLFKPDANGNYWPRMRGGSFLHEAAGLSCASRNSGYNWRDSSVINLGFRAILPIKP